MKIPREGTLRRQVYDTVATRPGKIYEINSQLPGIPYPKLLGVLSDLVSGGLLEHPGYGGIYRIRR